MGDSEGQALSPPLSQIKGKMRLSLLGEATPGPSVSSNYSSFYGTTPLGIALASTSTRTNH